MARHLSTLFAAAMFLTVSCSEGAPAAPAAAVDHHCADLLVKTQVQDAVVGGVWNCLEAPVRAMFNGSGDGAVVRESPYFIGSRFIACDSAVCVYALSVEATTAGTTGLDETTMTVWLDRVGLVSHAAIPKPVP